MWFISQGTHASEEKNFVFTHTHTCVGVGVGGLCVRACARAGDREKGDRKVTITEVK